MNLKNYSTESDSREMNDGAISRRMIIGSSGMAFLGLLGGSVLGREQEEVDWERVKEAQEKLREMNREVQRRGQEASLQRLRERIGPEKSAFLEQVRNAGSVEDRMKVMQDWHVQQSMANLQKQLGASEEEWRVIQPRLETVYRLRHPPASFAQEDTSPSAVVTRLTKELWELLDNKDAKPEEIKAKLTALRAAKEKVRQELVKARQDLRKLMSIRQEAVLVLSELLD